MLVESVKAGKDEREPYPCLDDSHSANPDGKTTTSTVNVSTVNQSLPRIFSFFDRRPYFLFILDAGAV
jgi:hypothetical protein